VPVSGTFTARDPETNVGIQWVMGTASVEPQLHKLTLLGTCVITTPNGVPMSGACHGSAEDGTSNGQDDRFNFIGSAENGSIFALCSTFGPCGLASGNVTID